MPCVPLLDSDSENELLGGAVIALDPGSRGPGSIPNLGHCVMFMGKTLYSHGASLHPDLQMSNDKFNAGGNPAMD